jgi:L-iditol 2-dehydrogenase
MTFLGAAPTDGGMQEYVLVRSDHAFAIPDTLSDEASALVEPLSVAVHGVSRAHIREGSSVLVIGAGPIGVLCAIVASNNGAGTVTIIDPDADRCELARSLTGAEILDQTGLGQRANSFDVALECSGSSQGLNSAIQSVMEDGKIVVLGVGVDRLDIPMNVLQEGEITITGSHRYRDTWPRAIELLANGVVDVSKFVTHRFVFEAALDAILAPRTQVGVLKAIIRISKG